MTTTLPTTPTDDALSHRERELSAIISAYNDVTDRLKDAHERLNREVARLREELRQKNEELRRRERLAALGEMAAGLAHEIRNPLGGISLYASLLEQRLTDVGGPESNDACSSLQAARRISVSARDLERLVSDILDFAQEYRLECRPCRFGDLLSDTEDRLQSRIETRGVSLDVDSATRDVGLVCDPVRMRQVLFNLMANAAEAVADGGHIWVRARDSERRGRVRIEVMDDGPGIPPAQMGRIFNPFFTTRPTGTGLGLAIVHRIVEAHGGAVRAGSRPEGGARFLVDLPAS